MRLTCTRFSRILAQNRQPQKKGTFLLQPLCPSHLVPHLPCDQSGVTCKHPTTTTSITQPHPNHTPSYHYLLYFYIFILILFLPFFFLLIDIFSLLIIIKNEKLRQTTQTRILRHALLTYYTGNHSKSDCRPPPHFHAHALVPPKRQSRVSFPLLGAKSENTTKTSPTLDDRIRGPKIRPSHRKRIASALSVKSGIIYFRRSNSVFGFDKFISTLSLRLLCFGLPQTHFSVTISSPFAPLFAAACRIATPKKKIHCCVSIRSAF